MPIFKVDQPIVSQEATLKRPPTHKQMCDIYERQCMMEASESRPVHQSGNVTRYKEGAYFDEDTNMWMRHLYPGETNSSPNAPFIKGLTEVAEFKPMSSVPKLERKDDSQIGTSRNQMKNVTNEEDKSRFLSEEWIMALDRSFLDAEYTEAINEEAGK